MEKIPADLDKLSAALKDLWPALNLPQKKQRLGELEDSMQGEDFWKDRENSTALSQKHSFLKKFIDFWEELEQRLEILKETDVESSEYKTELHALVEDFHQKRLLALFTGVHDQNNAIVAVHAGAGGTDAQDWAEMVLRMLSRYAEHHEFSVEIMEIQKGNEAGIKSVLLEVKGPYAYGYFKSEAGVHRLVRLSPYNPAHTRETSFCLVEVLPEIAASKEDVLQDKDVEMEVTTASGHGGQSVNTTYSAVRLTHKPTGIRVSIQNERSQQQNRELAYKILRARLEALHLQKLADEKKELRGEFKSAEWGNQIRSYVLHPYKMVKDHRTDTESSDPESVLEGELDEFVAAYLERMTQVT